MRGRTGARPRHGEQSSAVLKDDGCCIAGNNQRGVPSRSDATIDSGQIASRALMSAYKRSDDAERKQSLAKLKILCFKVGV
jgi:hypothetical protein